VVIFPNFGDRVPCVKAPGDGLRGCLFIAFYYFLLAFRR
jgi:hypothetical protein